MAFVALLPRFLLRSLAAIGCAGVIAGCAHYQLGTGAKLTFDTLYIAPVIDDALVPQSVALVSREVRSAFLESGRVQLVATPEEADAVLTITLIDFGRTVTTSRPEDTGLARKFDLTLRAAITLIDQRAQTPLLERRELQATRQIFTDGGQLPAEYQSLPLLARQLADQITHAVLDVW